MVGEYLIRYARTGICFLSTCGLHFKQVFLCFDETFSDYSQKFDTDGLFNMNQFFKQAREVQVQYSC